MLKSSSGKSISRMSNPLYMKPSLNHKISCEILHRWIHQPRRCLDQFGIALVRKDSSWPMNGMSSMSETGHLNSGCCSLLIVKYLKGSAMNRPACLKKLAAGRESRPEKLASIIPYYWCFWKKTDVSQLMSAYKDRYYEQLIVDNTPAAGWS